MYGMDFLGVKTAFVEMFYIVEAPEETISRSTEITMGGYYFVTSATNIFAF